MKRISNYLFLFVSLVCFNGALLAQHEISLPYECGFEDSEDLSQWVLNAGPDGANCMDQWMVGNCDNYVGYQSLYISSDTGQNVNYGYKPNYVMAYRPFQITDTVSSSPRLRINVSFAWKGMGVMGYTYTRFYLVPARQFENILNSSSSSSRLPRAFMISTDDFASAPNWEYYSHTENIKVNTKYYLVFIWVNSNVDKERNELSFCLDDLQITNADCGVPTIDSVVVTGDTMAISWDAPHTNFDIEYKLSSQVIWKRVSDIQIEGDEPKQYVLTGLDEGVYDIRIRGLCPDINLESAWVSQTGIVVYLPERHCINYVELDDPERVQCLTDSVESKPIDLGSKDKRSRHTVNWKQGEYDSRTGNRLRTIPEGSFASVRLGNWEIGGESEGIEYDYLVDTMGADILLVKYAVVLESPAHGVMNDPYFRIEILDETGNVIDSQCGGDMVLTPTDNEWPWNLYSSRGSISYVWTDWTSIGLDLSSYHGQMVKIRFTTRDCTLGAHAGYAYFTLDCMDSKINVEGCGDILKFEAPDGFRYTWTRGEDRYKVISTEKILSVPGNDDATYYCILDRLDKEGCGFELSASARPRMPYADFEWEWIPSNCEENKIALINKSCVYTRIGGKDVATDEPCEGIEWIVGDSIFRGEDIDYIFPKEGGSFLVTLRAYVSEGMCWDDTSVVINVPRLGAYRDTIYAAICFGDFYLVNNEFFAASGIYVDTLVSVAGCDSIIVLDLTVLPTVDVDTMITINEGEQLEFAGEIYTEAGIYHIDRVLDTVCQNITLYLIVETALEDVNVTDLVIVPNPIRVDDNAVVEYDWSVEEQEGLRVEIINSLGQRVDVFEPKSYPIVLPRVGGAGIYYVRITTGVGSVYVGKLIVEDR